VKVPRHTHLASSRDTAYGGQEAAGNRLKKTGWKQKVETIGKKIRFDGRKLLKRLARPEGFEPPTLRSEV
jgi:hypothetical protein